MRVHTYAFVCNQLIKRIRSYDLVSPRGIIKITNNSAKCGPKICPSSEDFVTQRTSTKCGPKIAPRQEDFAHSGLQPNVVPKLPLVGGLCHTADFDQMLSKNCPSSEDFVAQRTSTKCGPYICPSLEDFVSQRTVTRCGREFFFPRGRQVTQRTPTKYGL